LRRNLHLKRGDFINIAIIGGGAAGFFAAIVAAEKNPNADIVIFEAAAQPLAKLLISGGGRCNLTNHCLNPDDLIKNYPRGHKELRSLFAHFGPKETIDWFGRHGVRVKTEEEGRVFPVTDKAATVVEAFRKAATDLKIKTVFRAGITAIKPPAAEGEGSRYEIFFKDKISRQFDRVLLATGGSPAGYKLAAALGHTIIPPVPSLFTFQLDDPRLRELSGISFDNVELTLAVGKKKIKQSGTVLITHWGLSGPAVLKLSAWGARVLHDHDYHAELTVNFLPSYSEERLLKGLHEYKVQFGKRKVVNAELFPVPKRYWQRIVQRAAGEENIIWANLTKGAINAIIRQLHRAEFEVTGKGSYKEEFVTCGGVSLKEVDFKTMESKRCPGLYFAGEILDIDGLTGGFNFQSCWTTGYFAGTNMVL
jgi:predicted Rossmann fold flavoprotein